MTQTADRGRWSAFSVCLLAAGLAVLDISKVYVAIPTIETALGANTTDVQLIISGYVLAFGVVLVPAGRFGDLRSRRTLFLVGLVLFGVASFGCAFAPTAPVLVAARLLEGAASGILMPQVLGLVQVLFRGPSRGTAFGIFGAAIGLTLALAPPLGGVLMAIGGDDWGWRFVFLMNVPIVAVMLPIAIRLLPRRQQPSTGPRDLDPVGVVLLTVTTLGIMLPFVVPATPGDVAVWLLVPAALLVGALFVWWERRYAAQGRTPVVDLDMLRNPGYRNGVLIALLYYGGSPAMLLSTILFVQAGYGFGSMLAGVSIVPFAITYSFVAWWSGRNTYRYGRALVVFGLAGVMVGWSVTIAVSAFAPLEAAHWLVPLSTALAGIGAGCVAPPNQTLTLSEIPPAQGGLAGSITQVGQRLGAAIGAAVVTAAFYGVVGREPLARIDLPLITRGFWAAVAVTMLFFMAALVIALLDQRWRRRHGVTLA